MRDSRRRRMMLRDEIECEESFGVETEQDSAEDFGQPDQPAYTAGARIENQPKLVDFIPTRAFLVCGIFLVLVAVMALLNIAHFKIVPIANAKGISAGALELSLDRSLLSWVASFLLLATAFFCFQVFQVRRFRADDFTGSYRVWIWLAVGFILASIDATARISPIIAKLISSNWETGLLSVDRNVWYLMVGVPAAIVASRLVVEIWKSRIAIGSICVATVAYVAANIVRLDFMSITEQNHSVVEANSVLVAHSFLFFTIVCYARFVMVESQENQSSAAAIETVADEADVIPHSGSDASSQQKSKSKEASETVSKQKRKVKKREVEDDHEEVDDSQEQTTLKLMGQSVQPKKKKRKGGQQSRRRAA